jgi:hypothetical protein
MLTEFREYFITGFVSGKTVTLAVGGGGGMCVGVCVRARARARLELRRRLAPTRSRRPLVRRQGASTGCSC